MLQADPKYREYLFSKLKSYGETEEALLQYKKQGLREYCWYEDNNTLKSFQLDFLLRITRRGIFETYLDLNLLETK